jgi:membrane protein DedA with SNARE-associated domain/rhodanese-related sulfurtransferase
LSSAPISIVNLLAEHPLASIFGAVLVHQLGVPVPAFALLLWAGSRALDDPPLALAAFVLSLIAGTAGNLPWFWAGRRYGHRILRLACRVTLSPDSCVRQAENTFERRGPAMLVIARFLPALETLAPPLAGALGIGTPAFLANDAIGGALWTMAGLALGAAFRGQIEWLLDWLAQLGEGALLLIGALIAGYVAYRLLQRWLFVRSLKIARISAQELYAMISRGDKPLVLDVRTRANRRLDARRIPSALAVDLDDVERTLDKVPRDREVVVYCACPNEATAAKVALQLRGHGFRHVRPLAGGIDAWVSAGLAVDVIG